MKYYDLENRLTKARVSQPAVKDPILKQFGEIVLAADELENADVAIVGVPFTGGSRRAISPRSGPQGIRKGLSYFRTFSCELGVDLSSLKIVDLGDLAYPWYDYDKLYDALNKVLTAILSVNATPIILGGDHSISYPCVKSIATYRKSRMGLIWIDCHTDNFPEIFGNPYSNGCPVTRILELDNSPILPENVAFIGPRGFALPEYAYKDAEKTGMKILTMEQIDNEGIETISKEAVNVATRNTDTFYLSVDIDSVDGSAATGTQSPYPGGLTASQLWKAVRTIAKSEPVAMDLVEVIPELDTQDMTVRIAAGSILEFLAGKLWKRAKNS